MDGWQKPFCGENKVDSPLGLFSLVTKTSGVFDSDIQNDEFWRSAGLLGYPGDPGSSRSTSVAGEGSKEALPPPLTLPRRKAATEPSWNPLTDLTHGAVLHVTNP